MTDQKTEADNSNISSKSQPPVDQKLVSLLADARKGKIKCRKAVIELGLIKPFSNFKPPITPAFRAKFLKGYLNLKPPVLYVYQHNSQLMMSDDYTAYYMYMEVQAETALCIIIGDYTEQKGITAGPELATLLAKSEMSE